MPKPAARMTDMTQHGGVIMPPCAIKTMIEMLPAARVTDMHTCPMVTGVVPHVGGPIIIGSFTVFIEFLPAARVMDQLICVGPPDMIAKGAAKTFIGDPMGGSMSSMAPPAPPAPPDAPAAPGAPPAPAAPPTPPAHGQALAAVSQCTTEGDPIDVATGRMFTGVEEFETQGEPHFAFTRFYSTSGRQDEGAFGWGWLHSLEERIELGKQTGIAVDPETGEEREVLLDTVTYCDWQGRRILFPAPPPEEEYLHHLVEKITLRRHENGYFVEDSRGRRLRFESLSALDVSDSLRLVSISNASGESLLLGYAGGRLSKVTDPLGNEYSFDWKDGRHITGIRYRSADRQDEFPIATYTYDAEGNLSTATDAVGSQWRYQYDRLHRMSIKTDRIGHSFRFEYDTWDRCTRTWGDAQPTADGRRQTADGFLFDQRFEYSETEPITVVRDRQGHATTYEYDEFGMVTRAVDCEGNEKKYKYEIGNLVEVTDANGQATEYRYDPQGRLIATKTAEGAETTSIYDEDGALTTVDAEGNIVLVAGTEGGLSYGLPDQTPLMTVVEDELHPGSGHAILICDAEENARRLVYDLAGRVVSYQEPLGGRYSFQYDTRGSLTAVVDPAGTTCRFDYDRLGRLTGLGRPDGVTMQIAYDGEGNLSHFVDGNGHTSRLRHGALGALLSVKEPDGREIRYDYDGFNRLSQITDPGSHLTTLDYHDTGLLSRIVHPDGHAEFYTYDPAGRLRRFLDRGGMSADCDYDKDGHLTEIRCGDGATLTFAYDGDGRVLRAEGEGAAVQYAYDALGRVVKETQNDSTVEYEYNANGALKAIVTPVGERVEYRYDANGRLNEVVDWDGGIHSFEYENGRQVRAHNYPNGLTTRYRYSPAGLTLAASLEGAAPSAPLSSETFGYDGNDRLTEWSDSRLGQARYRYDPSGRLIAVESTDESRTEQFSYDANGNIRGRRGAADSSFDVANRLLAGPGIRCQYDRRGNLIFLEQAGRGNFRFSYDGLGRLTRAQIPGGATAEYVYDPFGRRILKRYAGTETYYLWAGDQLLAEMSTGEKEEMRWYHHLPGSFTPLGMRVDGVPYYFHTDHRGTPIRVTNGEGQIAWEADYAAYGEARPRVERIRQPIRLPGQYHDEETGLHYNRARYYHPGMGRYLSPDPLGLAGGLNLYIYADCDPVNQTDPLGRAPKGMGSPSVGASVSSAVRQEVKQASAPPVPQSGAGSADSGPQPASGQASCGDAGSASPNVNESVEAAVMGPLSLQPSPGSPESSAATNDKEEDDDKPDPTECDALLKEIYDARKELQDRGKDLEEDRRKMQHQNWDKSKPQFADGEKMGSIEGHIEQYEGVRNRLNKLLKQWEEKDSDGKSCYDKTSKRLPDDVYKLAKEPAPRPIPQRKDEPNPWDAPGAAPSTPGDARRLTCVGVSTAVGAAAGAAAAAAAGATACTLAAPGVGTVGCGAVGAQQGAGIGAAVGAGIGAAICK